MRSLYQQRAQISVPLLGDAQLRLALPRFALLGPQAHVAAHVAALLKALAILHRQHKRQSDQGSYSAHLRKESGFRILDPGDLLDMAFQLFDVPLTLRSVPAAAASVAAARPAELPTSPPPASRCRRPGAARPWL